MISPLNTELLSTWTAGKSGAKRDKMTVEMKYFQFSSMIVLILSWSLLSQMLGFVDLGPKSFHFQAPHSLLKST